LATTTLSDNYFSSVAAIDITTRTATMVAQCEYLELIREPSLSIVLFRRIGWNAQVAFATPTAWEGETIARLAFVHPDTTDEMVTTILESMN
jgi:hypothetical protein